ncbi:MAG: glutaredoxin family protein [Caldilineaceae bacterium]|nr:glutaredoxin family protein [Caldilineaceae bacterium]MCB0096494.1 glutaredoxin family protein [Caldilineaceae bacterium]MCB9149791.1 glutaredoxin family protein [Caldilineaceae bacterium]
MFTEKLAGISHNPCRANWNKLRVMQKQLYSALNENRSFMMPVKRLESAGSHLNRSITLYSKPGCHLCEEVKADLLALQPEVGFLFYEQNIEEDPALYELFRYLIPVVDIEDGPLFYAPIDMSALRGSLIDISVQ